MLNHHNTHPELPQRIVILGAKGFLGGALLKCLHTKSASVVGLGRQDIDLLGVDASKKLLDFLQPTDALVIAAANAPCKNPEMLADNILMMRNICRALSQRHLQQVIYVSSDAVYADSVTKLDENSTTAPGSLHGIMHLAREQMLASALVNTPFLIVRPSLLYGVHDPHNGYGPNSFYRFAKKGENIVLFGQGEEKRDHVFIDDVAQLLTLCLLHGSVGTLNIATGNVLSFYDIANEIRALFENKIQIIFRPRSGPMPHNGYRAFSIAVCEEAFPNFQYTSFGEALKKIHNPRLNMSEHFV